MSYQSTSLRLRASDGVEVPAVLVEPREARGSFLLLHGISTDKDEYLGFLAGVAEDLGDAGYRSLRIDFRGHGESDVPPADFTVGSQLLDVLAAIVHLREISKVPVNLFGCSFGAPPCLLASLWAQDSIGSIALLAPVLDYRRTFIEPESQWGLETFPAEAVRDCLESGAPIPLSDDFAVGPRLLASMLHSDLPSVTSNLRRPVQIFHGEADGMVALRISQDAAERNPNLELHQFPHMEHGFTHDGDEDGTQEETRANVRRMIALLLAGADANG